MKRKILVADDDADNRIIARAILEASGYDVVEAKDGEEAMAAVFSERPDALLLDLSMPKINGWEVARQLREKPSVSHMPIIAFTAHAIIGDELKAKAAGCDDYISKPCAPIEVLNKIKKWLPGGPEAKPE